MTEFLLGFLCGVGATVGLFLLLTKMTGTEPWEDPLLPTKGPPKDSK